MIGVALDHVAIHVDDREAAIRVVRELLGHESIQDLEVPGAGGTAHLTVMVQRGERFRLVLCDAEGVEHPIVRWLDTRGPGVHHIAHRVESVEQALALVANAGATAVGAIVETPELRQIFTTVAADGILHELTQRIGTEGFVERNVAALIDIGGLHNSAGAPAAWRQNRK